ncbi:hypothetical protein NUW54_g9498 [Trametes sanguinea]|uniref:Uncharacterized protein n=1 Tax=Trametes sanguinea TaxID=158606 RepID=A0ACC1P879_9APHY|nr:hypothetical protein NUW54_g9498 [Trametes sanguinea]
MFPNSSILIPLVTRLRTSGDIDPSGAIPPMPIAGFILIPGPMPIPGFMPMPGPGPRWMGDAADARHAGRASSADAAGCGGAKPPQGGGQQAPAKDSTLTESSIVSYLGMIITSIALTSRVGGHTKEQERRTIPPIHAPPAEPCVLARTRAGDAAHRSNEQLYEFAKHELAGCVPAPSCEAYVTRTAPRKPCEPPGTPQACGPRRAIPGVESSGCVRASFAMGGSPSCASPTGRSGRRPALEARDRVRRRNEDRGGLNARGALLGAELADTEKHGKPTRDAAVAARPLVGER